LTPTSFVEHLRHDLGNGHVLEDPALHPVLELPEARRDPSSVPVPVGTGSSVPVVEADDDPVQVPDISTPSRAITVISAE
jgi:hypothetical protein